MDADYWDSLLSESPPPRRGRRESRNLPEPPPEHATRPREELLAEPLPPPHAPPAPEASAASSGASGKRRKRKEPPARRQEFYCLLCQDPQEKELRRDLAGLKEHLKTVHPEQQLVNAEGKLEFQRQMLACFDFGGGVYLNQWQLLTRWQGTPAVLYIDTNQPEEEPAP